MIDTKHCTVPMILMSKSVHESARESVRESMKELVTMSMKELVKVSMKESPSF